MNFLKLLFFCTILYIPQISAQETLKGYKVPEPGKENFWKRVSVGGNLGFQIGNITGIMVAPEVSVRTVENFYVGTRLIYQYFYYKDYFYDYDTREYLSYQSNVFGGALFARYYLNGLFDNFLGNLFGHIEYEYLSYQRPFVQSYSASAHIIDPYGYYYEKGRSIVEINSFFVGGGFRQPVGNRVSMDILVLFNLNDTYNSPYSNPIIRFGVGVGL